MSKNVKVIYDDDLVWFSEENLIEKVKNLTEYDLDFIFHTLAQLKKIELNK